VGGGITGASLYHRLSSMGYRVGLIDKGDFASGTSQASGMLVWGGLLYLKQFDFVTVRKLCNARNAFFRRFPEAVSPLDLRFRAEDLPWWKRWPMLAGLGLYWLIGSGALRPPRLSLHRGLQYQEGMLRESDSRFVVAQIGACDSEHAIALNYCALGAASYDSRERCWRIELTDTLSGRELTTRARTLVNAGGVWADRINKQIGLEAPCKHAFSKGVYLALPPRGEQSEGGATIYPMPGKNDVLTHVPWGPVMMWGPTETASPELEPALHPNREDVRFLLQSASHCFSRKVDAGEVISLRCGVRPLAVRKDYTGGDYPLELSRRHWVVAERGRRAVAIFGGKFTSSFDIAEEVLNILKAWAAPRFSPSPNETSNPPTPERINVAGLPTPVISPGWSRDHEFCTTLEDYLRRRTPLAQWLPRMGLGRDGEYRPFLLELAAAFASGTMPASALVDAYEQKIRETYDPLLEL